LSRDEKFEKDSLLRAFRRAVVQENIVLEIPQDLLIES
jgi:hypothetical protein